MAHLPKTNDIVVVHHVIEDAGVDQYHTFKMIDSIIDEGIEVYILKNRWGGYLAATHRDFEYIHYPEEQGFKGEIDQPEMSVIDIDNKGLVRVPAHEHYNIVVTVDVFNRKYQVAAGNNVSDKVIEDIAQHLNEMITIDNFTQFLGKVFNYKVTWKKTKYEWTLI